MKILLCTPPMVQINTPYPATAYLTGFLRLKHPEIEVAQYDAGLELLLRLFSRKGLERVLRRLTAKSKAAEFFKIHFTQIAQAIDPCIAYLQGKNPELTEKILRRDFIPEGPRFQPLWHIPELQEKFRALSAADQAKHLASLFLDDLADLLKFCIDERFELVRYGERLAASQNSFDLLFKHLTKNHTLIDEILEEITREIYEKEKPELFGLSVPFSGTMYGALRMGKVLKSAAPNTKIIIGGGYPNTELRELSDARVFQFVDYITLDDGERPLECLLEFFAGKREKENLLRTFALDETKKVRFYTNSEEHDIPFRSTGTPTYSGLKLDKYISMFEMLNPVNRLWSDQRWNKLTLAHGCYWRRCSFCDTSLEYISRYDGDKAEHILEKMIALTKETGFSGFHFVDEAAPPNLLSALADLILARGLSFTWWGNIRFDKNFTPELTKKLRASGCIAVTGGLEVASPRLLALIDKGLTIEQVARVSKSFQEAGIFVHAYLMYGFPTQSAQETIDSLEIVRQLFLEKCLSSAFWHRFAATIHSPVGKNPEKFQIKILPSKPSQHGLFALNDLRFEDPKGCDHEKFGEGLRTALYNYMHGVGLELDVRKWFEKVPKPKIPATFIRDSLCKQ